MLTKIHIKIPAVFLCVFWYIIIRLPVHRNCYLSALMRQVFPLCGRIHGTIFCVFNDVGDVYLYCMLLCTYICAMLTPDIIVK